MTAKNSGHLYPFHNLGVYYVHNVLDGPGGKELELLLLPGDWIRGQAPPPSSSACSQCSCGWECKVIVKDLKLLMMYNKISKVFLG